MTPEQFVAVLGGLGAVLTAAAAVLVQVNRLNAKVDVQHELLNGQVAELLTVSQLAARKQGELEGRDWATTAKAPQPRSEAP